VPGAGITVLLRRCTAADLPDMVAVVNSAATAYAGVIPEDRYHQPFMPLEEMTAEIAAGVRFWGLFERGREKAAAGEGEAWTGEAEPVAGEGRPAAPLLAGVMGIQDVDDVTLIRHAYVRPDRQRAGVGARLLAHLLRLADRDQRPLLVGTWAAAWWAVAFYERHGFVLVTPAEKDRLLRRYWSIPDRQVETSVVLRYQA
jgi:GNAT superfamily N-acetyltransferase